MTEAQIILKLQASGVWRPGLHLEPFELLPGQAPDGALQGLQTLMLVDEQYQPTRGSMGRGWRPLLIVADALYLDPSPRMLDQLLAAAGYWENPEAYGDMLLLQFHRFALDFFEGYQVREEQFARMSAALLVTGEASRGSLYDLQRFTYETRVGREEPAVFSVQPAGRSFLD